MEEWLWKLGDGRELWGTMRWLSGRTLVVAMPPLDTACRATIGSEACQRRDKSAGHVLARPASFLASVSSDFFNFSYLFSLTDCPTCFAKSLLPHAARLPESYIEWS